MASRTLQFFARRDEFLALLARIVETLGLTVLVAREDTEGVEWQVLHALTHESIDRTAREGIRGTGWRMDAGWCQECSIWGQARVASLA
jgi:hypothetical protein